MGGAYGIWMVLSSLISAVMGGGLIYLFTLKSQRKKAKAEAEVVEANADGVELSNVQTAIKIWREMSEKLSSELDEQMQKSEKLKGELISLSNEVYRLTNINTQVKHLIDKITPENFEQTVNIMKKIISNGN